MAPLTIPLDDRPFPGDWCRCCGARVRDVSTLLLCSGCCQASSGVAGRVVLRCATHGRYFDRTEVAR